MAFSGRYKGTRFRSLLELSIMVTLERSGLTLGERLLYEQTRIPYGKTRIRNYVVDLTIPDLKILIECKPASRADNKNNRAKRAAAEEWAEKNGWKYLIVTDEMVQKHGHLITLEGASTMAEVELGERAMRTLRRREKRKKKK